MSQLSTAVDTDPGAGRSLFHQRIFHWLWLKAVWPQLVWGLQLRTSCVAFARSLHVLTHTCIDIYTPKMRPVAGWGGEKAIWGATELIAVRILWEVLALYIIPSLGMVGLIFLRRRGVLFVLTELGGAEEELGSQKRYAYSIQSVETSHLLISDQFSVRHWYSKLLLVLFFFFFKSLRISIFSKELKILTRKNKTLFLHLTVPVTAHPSTKILNKKTISVTYFYPRLIAHTLF